MVIEEEKLNLLPPVEVPAIAEHTVGRSLHPWHAPDMKSLQRHRREEPADALHHRIVHPVAPVDVRPGELVVPNGGQRLLHVVPSAQHKGLRPRVVGHRRADHQRTEGDDVDVAVAVLCRQALRELPNVAL